MITPHHIKTGFRILLTIFLFVIKAIWYTFVIIISFLVGAAEVDEDDEISSPIGDNYNYRTGQIDAVKHPSDIYDERKF